ncbi:MAG: hypothetical protein H0V56_06810 [Chthoniobacterales bacterium]|nr:hypothetical protein [Chthoniobacterales bacterium]
MMIYKALSFTAAAALAFSTGSLFAQDHSNDHAPGHGPDHAAHAAVATIKIEVLPDANHAAGKTAQTIVRLTGPGGKPVTLDDLEVAHTEKLHLLVVNEALTDYHHEHPVGSDKPGEYRFEFTPKHGGTYHVWADLLPLATKVQEYTHTFVQVKGTPAQPQNTTNTTAEVDGYRFDWTVEGNQPLRGGESVEVKVRVTGADGQPFQKLEPVMGAFAHMVAFPENLKSVTHVHPTGREPEKEDERGGPELTFHVVPEQAGYQKFYLQVQIGGQDKFAAFGVNVEPLAAGGADLAKVKHICPMCAGVENIGPGKCPKCGMALVPETKAEDAKAHEH